MSTPPQLPAMPQLPKLSEITSNLRGPEAQIEGVVSQIIPVKLPPGPVSMIVDVQRSIETGMDGGGLPALPMGLPVPPTDLQTPADLTGGLSQLPKLPALPMQPELPQPPIGGLAQSRGGRTATTATRAGVQLQKTVDPTAPVIGAGRARNTQAAAIF